MSKHSLLRLTSSLYNTPQLIDATTFDTILGYLHKRNDGLQMLMPNQPPPQASDTEEEEPDDMDDFDESPLPVVVINIEGSLSYKPVETMCGVIGTSYQGLEEDVEEAIEDGATTIIMNFASGGGQAQHCFETANNIRAMCDEAGVKLIGYIDEISCSASYAISCVCDELYINPTACAGSIGCVVALLDSSENDKQEGYKRIYITSGANKVPFDEAGAFKKEFLQEIQDSVDKMNNSFVEHVAKYTGIDAKIIRGFEAASFDAEDSLSNGLVNGIMTNREFVKYVVQNVTTDKGSM